MGNDQQNETETVKPIEIEISEDKMEAYLTLHTPAANMPAYGQMEVMGALDDYGVRGGVDKNAVTEMIFDQVYDEKRLVAKGSPAIDGIDGYFEYFFHQKDKESGKPRILDDGSVDYTSVNTVGTVSEGDLVAIYNPAVPGKFGYNVTGELLKPKPAKGLPVPNLVGCRYEEETESYYSMLDGKIEATLSKIEVTGVLDINRKVNVAYGSVYFMGDVNIFGDVDSGVEIIASGNINITGTVQGSTLIAGENITVKGGIIGDEKVQITCGGNIESRYIQYANVVAGGDVIIKTLLDCDVYAGGMIMVDDKNGTISGGDMYSAKGMDGQVFGNQRKVKTRLAIGRTNEALNRKMDYPKLIAELDVKIKAITAREIKLGRESKDDKAKRNLLHIIRQNKASLLAQKKSLEGLYWSIDSLYGPEEVTDYIYGRHFYPGVIISINMREKAITDELVNVRFRCRDQKITFTNEEED